MVERWSFNPEAASKRQSQRFLSSKCQAVGSLIRDFLIVSVPLSEVSPQVNSNSGVRSRPRRVHQPFDS